MINDSGCDQTKRKPTQIEEQIDCCEKGICNLETSINTLENRLGGVLTKFLDCKKTEGNVEIELVPLASVLRTFANRINKAVGKINDIEGRIEI
jgi:chromosome segregation ATPase